MKLAKIQTKGALELSISTVVVIVIGMSMLILGLVLVRTIFTGAKYNVDSLNKNVEAEINKLFNEQGGRTYVYLPDNQADVSKGDTFGVAFAVKNDVRGEAVAGNFQYEVKASEVQKGCALSLAQADGYLTLGSKGNFALLPGDEPKFNLVKISIPESAPLCQVRYDIIVRKDSQPYKNEFFDINIA